MAFDWRSTAAASPAMTCAVTDSCVDSVVDDVTPSTHALVDLVGGVRYAF